MNTTLPIKLSTSEGRYYLDATEIIRLEASSSYTIFHLCNGRKIVASKVMKNFTPVLESLGFIRTHKTHLVNRQFVSSIISNSIIMKDESKAIISRRMKRHVLSKMGTTLN